MFDEFSTTFWVVFESWCDEICNDATEYNSADKYDNEQRSPKSIEDIERYICKEDFYGDNILFALNTEPLPSGSFPQYATITIDKKTTYCVRTDWYTDERPTHSFQKFLETLKNHNLLPGLQVTVCKDGKQIYPSQQ